MTSIEGDMLIELYTTLKVLMVSMNLSIICERFIFLSQMKSVEILLYCLNIIIKTLIYF